MKDIPTLNIRSKIIHRKISSREGTSRNKTEDIDLCLYCKRHRGLFTQLWHLQMQTNVIAAL